MIRPILSTLAGIVRAPGPARVRLRLLALVLVAVARGALAGDISYPVDVASTRWALLDDVTGKLVASDVRWPRLDGRRYRLDGYTWLLRVVEPPPVVDGRIFDLTPKQDIRKADHQLLITWQVAWRTKEQMEASLDAAVIEHALACAQGQDVQAACAAAAGLAQQLADGDLTATASEKRRAKKCAAWVKACVRPNEANGDRLLTDLRAARNTRNDPVPAPVPNLDNGWTDAPPAAP